MFVVVGLLTTWQSAVTCGVTEEGTKEISIKLGWTNFKAIKYSAVFNIDFE